MTDQRLLIPLGELLGLDLHGLNVYEPDGNRLGVALRLDRDGRLVVARHRDDWVTSVEPDDYCLNFGDASSRDRCLRWLARQVGLKVAGRCPWWWALVPVMSSSSRALHHGWGLGYSAHSQYWSFGVGRITECPALNGLDSGNDTCLPDGSRLVDALALAAVVCHLGGLR